MWTGGTLQVFAIKHTVPGATLFADEAKAHKGSPLKHEVLKHSVGEYVSGKAHTNGIESFWAMLRCGQ